MKEVIYGKNFLVSKDVITLLLRLILAIIFIAHGSQKVLGIFGGYGLEATTTWMHVKLGIPFIFAYIGCFMEFFGGIGLLFGLFSRFWGLGLTIQMLVAMLTSHKGFFAPTGIEYPLTLMLIAITIFLTGSGKYSLDRLFSK